MRDPAKVRAGFIQPGVWLIETNTARPGETPYGGFFAVGRWPTDEAPEWVDVLDDGEAVAAEIRRGEALGAVRCYIRSRSDHCTFDGLVFDKKPKDR